jgi:hypothetical protein
MSFARTSRYVGIVAAGLVVLAASRAAGAECRVARPDCVPGVQEHGPIADVPLDPPGVPAPVDVISGGESPALSPLTPVETADRADDVRRGLPDFDPRDTLFVSSLNEKVDTLRSCRVEAARARQLRPGELPEDTVHLRLWVSFDGKVSDSAISATGALGPSFLDCAKRTVRGWWLIPPEGGTGAFVDVDVDFPTVGLPTVRGLSSAVASSQSERQGNPLSPEQHPTADTSSIGHHADQAF